MNWDALGAIGELVGAGAVVLTLIYLAVQVRMSAKQQRIESNRNVNEEFNRIMVVWYDTEKAGMIIRAWSDWSNATAQEQNILAIYLIQLSNHMQTLYSMWKHNALNESDYLKQETNFLSHIATDGGTQWWSIFTNIVGPDFATRINQELQTGDYAPLSTSIPWANVEHWRK